MPFVADGVWGGGVGFVWEAALKTAVIMEWA